MRKKIIVNIVLGMLIILVIGSGSYILYKEIEKNNTVLLSDCPNTETTCTCNCDYDEVLVENLGKNEFNNFYYYDGENITINDLSENDKFAIVYNKIQPNESYNFPINPGIQYYSFVKVTTKKYTKAYLKVMLKSIIQKDSSSVMSS